MIIELAPENKPKVFFKESVPNYKGLKLKLN